MHLIESLRMVMAPPHPAGRPFIAGAALLALLGLVLCVWHPGWGGVLLGLGVVLLLFCLYFFRDPERIAPARPGLVVAPADGRVVMVGPSVPPAELGLGDAPRVRVAIFLSVLNVHVNRVPVDAVVTRIAYRHGKYFNASLDKASEHNERNALALRLEDGRGPLPAAGRGVAGAGRADDGGRRDGDRGAGAGGARRRGGRGAGGGGAGSGAGRRRGVFRRDAFGRGA
jgi:phosphatidylserine decarboxylase